MKSHWQGHTGNSILTKFGISRSHSCIKQSQDSMGEHKAFRWGRMSKSH